MVCLKSTFAINTEIYRMEIKCPNTKFCIAKFCLIFHLKSLIYSSEFLSPLSY